MSKWDSDPGLKLTVVIVLCFGTRHYLSTRLSNRYKQTIQRDLINILGKPAMDWYPTQGRTNTLSCLMVQKPLP